MRPKNFPGRVFRRWARAEARKDTQYLPYNEIPEVEDMTVRLGASKRDPITGAHR